MGDRFAVRQAMEKCPCRAGNLLAWLQYVDERCPVGRAHQGVHAETVGPLVAGPHERNGGQS